MRVVFVLVAAVLFLGNSGAIAQRVSICVEFNSFQVIQEDGYSIFSQPSGLSTSEKQSVLDGIEAKFTPVSGAGSVSVHDIKDGFCDSCSIHIIISGDTGADSYGDFLDRAEPAVVHEGLLRKDGFSGSQLATAIGETAGHLAGHMYGLRHTPDPNDLMATSDGFVDAAKIATPRYFSPAEIAKLKNNIPLCPRPFAATGPTTVIPFGASAKSKVDNILDQTVSYTALTPAMSKLNVGYMSADGQFLDADDDDYENAPHQIAVPTRQPLDAAVQDDNGDIIRLLNFVGLITDEEGQQLMGLLDVNNDHKVDAKIFLAGGSSSFQVAPATKTATPEDNAVLRRGFTQDAGTSYTLTKRSLRISRYPYWEGSTERTPPVAEYPMPVGREANDIRVSGPRTTSLGNTYQRYKVVLDDGSILVLSVMIPGDDPAGPVEIRLVSHYPFPKGGTADQGEAWDKVRGDPFILGGNVVYSFDSSANQWVVDSAGLNNAYVQDIDMDTNQVLYAATDRGIYIQPPGNAWHKSSFNFPVFERGFLSVFADAKNHLHVCSTINVWVSNDGGATFTLDTAGLRLPTLNGNYHLISFGQDALGNIYGIPQPSDGQPGIFQHAPGGKWKLIAQSISAESHDPSITNIFNDVSGNATTLCAATVFGSYASSDHGATWQKERTGLHAQSYYSMAKTANNTMVLGTDLGLFSGYYGDTAWQRSFPSTGYMSMKPFLLNEFVAPQNSLFADASGTLRTLGRALTGFNSFQATIATSTDGGHTWIEDSAGLAPVQSHGLYFVDGSGKQYIATLDSRGNNIYSRPVGGAWALDQTGFTKKGTYEIPLAFASTDASTLFLATSSGMVWKYNAGTWSPDTAGLNGTGILALAAGKLGDVFGGTLNGAIMHNSNGNWTRIPIPPSVPFGAPSYYLATDDAGTLFAEWVTSATTPIAPPYLGHGLWFTKDMGQHWAQTGVGDSVIVNGICSSADTIYLLTDRGYFDASSRLWTTAHVKEGPVIHFDTTAIGKTETKTLTITNFGNDTLHISHIDVSGPFSVPAGTTSIAPRGVVRRQVSFTPTSSSSATGMAVISSNSEDVTDTVFFDGVGSASNSVSGSTIAEFGLEQNYPNPFTASTTITYSLPERTHVLVRVSDVLGRVISTPVSVVEDAGIHDVRWMPSEIPGGVYTITMYAGGFQATRKMTVVK